MVFGEEEEMNERKCSCNTKNDENNGSNVSVVRGAELVREGEERDGETNSWDNDDIDPTRDLVLQETIEYPGDEGASDEDRNTTIVESGEGKGYISL